MQPYTRMSKGALAAFAAGMIGVGSVAAVGMTALAQTSASSAPTAVVETQDPQDTDANGVQDTPAREAAEHAGGTGRSHAPIGNDGNVTAINGTTITMQEESDEGGASYTVDASSATVTKNGATAQLSDITIGDKIFVKGMVTGTNVVATSVSIGRPHGGMGGWFNR